MIRSQPNDEHPADITDGTDIDRFAESYKSFSRVINSLQRKYIELKEEFSAQHDELVEANNKLVELSKKNLAATEFLNGILNSVRVGVVAVDRDGAITHFNPAASAILGIPANDPMGKSYRDVMPAGVPFDADAFHSAETGREVTAVEKKVELNDGTILHLSVSTSVLSDDYGRRSGAVEVLHDLTQIKKMEQEIARLNTLAALGEMAATVAHEVRNPLAGIGGFAALMERDMEPDDPKRPLVQKIIRGVESLNETVTTLLNYTRFEEITRSQNIYADFLRATVKQYLTDNAEKIGEVTINLELPEESPQKPFRMVFDRMLFRTVFFNVFTNAIEAMQGSGAIGLTYRVLPRQTAVQRYGGKLLLALDETAVETVITDTGPGIDEVQLEKIFAPFFTTKHGGNGLGLAMVWKIVKAHGGDIIAKNRAGGGASFSIVVPIRIDGGVREM